MTPDRELDALIEALKAQQAHHETGAHEAYECNDPTSREHCQGMALILGKGADALVRLRKERDEAEARVKELEPDALEYRKLIASKVAAQADAAAAYAQSPESKAHAEHVAEKARAALAALSKGDPE